MTEIHRQTYLLGLSSPYLDVLVCAAAKSLHSSALLIGMQGSLPKISHAGSDCCGCKGRPALYETDREDSIR